MVSLRSMIHRRRVRSAPFTVMLVLLLVAGVVTATVYLAGHTTILTGTPALAPGGDCGFVTLPTTNVVGTGSQSGTPYISFSPSLSGTAVTQDVVATVNQYGTGSSGVEYLIDEVGFGCSLAQSGAVVSFSLSASASTTNAKWVAMEVSFDQNNTSVNTTSGIPCDRSGGGLYLPTGGVPSSFSHYSAGDANYTGGDTYVFSANQTGGAHLTDDACTANADSTHTTIPNLTLPTISSLVVIYYISFVITGASSSSAITNPAFTLSFI